MNRIQLVTLESFDSLSFKSIPESSIIRIGKNNFDGEFYKLKSRPLLSGNWFVLLNSNLSNKQVAKIFSYDKNYNLLNLKWEDEELFRFLNESKVPFSIVDNVHYSKGELKSFVSKELGIDLELAGKICAKCNWYYKYVYEEVSKLKFLSDVKGADYLKYVENHSRLNNYKLLYHILGFKKCSDKAVSTYLYQFRYAFKYVKTSLVSLLDSYMEVYELIANGELGEDNVNSFKYEGLSKYQVNMLVMDMHRVVSYTDLLRVKLILVKANDIMDILRLV